MRLDDVLNRLPKLPRYGYALLGGLSALLTVAIGMICVLAALVSMSPTLPDAPTPSLAAVTSSPCADPNTPDVNWQLEGSLCVVREQQAQDEAAYTLEMAYPADLAQYDVARTTMLTYLNQTRAEFWGAVPAAPVEGFGPYPGRCK
ncbi:hypothetical protein HC776_03475 [bacterium]|nr:hypothetical protein [bacterium]